MSNIVAFAGANLPAVSTLAKSLLSIQQDVGPSGVVILKMDKTGHWVFGADQTEVEDDSKWAVNPFSFVHGFIAWGDGEVLAEKMTTVNQPLPEMPEAPPGAKRGWEMQIGFALKCINGEDEGMECRYTTTSVGGKKAVQALAVEIANKVATDESKPVPVITLGKDYYQHKAYGRIFTPVFKVLDWMSMSGEVVTDDADATADTEQQEEPRRRRRA